MKKSILQIVSFVLLAGGLSIFSLYTVTVIEYSIVDQSIYSIAETNPPILQAIRVALSLIGGVISYAIWRKVWGTSQKSAIIIGILMVIILGLWISGATAIIATAGLLVYILYQ